MEDIRIKHKNVTEAFKSAEGCDVAISILTSLFGEQKPDYTDYHNIKTYENACEALGIKPISRLLVEYEDGHKEEASDIAHIAYMKLCTIARALNNDLEFPRFTADEYRWFPWYYLYSQAEIDDMDEEKRKELVFWGGVAYYGAYCGLASAGSSYAWSYSHASVGSRLAVKSKEVAEYFGKQFKELWRDFLIGKR